MQDVKLRLLTLEDIAEMLQWPKYQDPSTAWANLPAGTLEEGQEWLNTYQKPPRCYCMAVVNPGDQLVGRCNITLLDQETKVGGLFNFMIRPDMADLGYGQAAIYRLLEMGFDKLEMSAIYLYTGADNYKARHIYEKLGFQFMGTHYDYRKDQGYIRFVDLVAWREDWLAKIYKILR